MLMTKTQSISSRGFSSVELLIVVVLVVMLGSVHLAPDFNSHVRAREAVLKEDLFRMRDAIGQYYADKRRYPQSLQDLVSNGYLREIPEDPITDSAETWHTVPAESDPRNSAAGGGVSDVKSGAAATSLDGSRYSEWE
jgi:general secretion pathway protein G